MAIVYVGNAIIDPQRTNGRIEKACRYSGVDQHKLQEETKKCEYMNNSEELFQIAEIVSDYIKLLYEATPKEAPQTHWLVSALKQHADRTYCYNPTLKELSVIYHKNEKYLGRLFKKETGMSFHQYCLAKRLQQAESLLLKDSNKIIDIALECGFNNISYFNRAFKAQYGVPPTEYKAAKTM